ncbi:hypothetical protein [Streptomyces violaceorubidus]|uniref:Uncharacterized protein n=1 Tax=Streptomyces violaceorubidus TaxID=284042 RepID=A0ABV1SV17_9ACTN
MPLESVATHTYAERHLSAVGRLTALTADLAGDLDGGRWVPGPLERTLASRLLLACAGDGQLTPPRLRETLWEGSLALTYTGEGRLARLLTQSCEVAEEPVPEAESVLAEAVRLLERAARSGAADGDRH